MIESAEILDCPNCPNQGWYMVNFGGEYDEPEQVQCQFCYCEPNSRFNREQQEPS